MEIVFVRVDERLIHGQITIRWVKMVGANIILVANDEAANNTFQKNLMKMASPPGVTIEVESLDNAAKKINQIAWPNEKVMVIIKNPIDLLDLVEKGLMNKNINIGGVRQPGAKIKLSKEVMATEEELKAWKKLDEKGLHLEIQWLPDQGATNLNNVLKKYK